MKDVKIAFSVSGWVTTTVSVPDEFELDDLQRKLNDGTYVTTLQEGGTLDVLESGKEIGRVIDVDNELGYEDFEVTEGFHRDPVSL